MPNFNTRGLIESFSRQIEIDRQPNWYKLHNQYQEAGKDEGDDER